LKFHELKSKRMLHSWYCIWRRNIRDVNSRHFSNARLQHVSLHKIITSESTRNAEIYKRWFECYWIVVKWTVSMFLIPYSFAHFQRQGWKNIFQSVNGLEEWISSSLCRARMILLKYYLSFWTQLLGVPNVCIERDLCYQWLPNTTRITEPHCYTDVL
jgi:hypothetical protein